MIATCRTCGAPYKRRHVNNVYCSAGCSPSSRGFNPGLGAAWRELNAHWKVTGPAPLTHKGPRQAVHLIDMED